MGQCSLISQFNPTVYFKFCWEHLEIRSIFCYVIWYFCVQTSCYISFLRWPEHTKTLLYKENIHWGQYTHDEQTILKQSQYIIDCIMYIHNANYDCIWLWFYNGCWWYTKRICTCVVEGDLFSLNRILADINAINTVKAVAHPQTFYMMFLMRIVSCYLWAQWNPPTCMK